MVRIESKSQKNHKKQMRCTSFGKFVETMEKLQNFSKPQFLSYKMGAYLQ